MFGIILPFSNRESVAESLYKGVEHRVIDAGNGQVDAIIVGKNSAKLQVISTQSEEDAQEFNFRPYDSMTISEYCAKTRAIAVVSGGFMSSFSPPKELGALVIDGKIVSPPNSSWLGTGMFCTKGNDYVISEFNLSAASQFSDCVQSGPLFIRDGQIRSIKDISGPKEIV